ncbi:MAG: sigma-54 dependent transcriptional regulator [Alphaproteobacteria bacterium]
MRAARKSGGPFVFFNAKCKYCKVDETEDFRDEQMTEKTRILLVEDAPALARVYAAYIERAGHECLQAETLAEARSLLAQMPVDCVLLDLQLPDGSGMDLLAELTPDQPRLPVIMVTAHGSINNAVDAMRHGAWDFIVKPFTADKLAKTLDNVMARRATMPEGVGLTPDMAAEIEAATAERTAKPGKKPVRRKPATKDFAGSYHGFIGSSDAMQSVYRLIEAVAPSLATVFITGESGTGKEVCAEAIHKQSPRAAKPFVAINCGAIPTDLVESEIFGHVKGAFTGAVSDRPGAAREAHGGTLFLDELCELPIGLQAKLLRFLQTGMVQPVGANRNVEVDLRIICATNRNPLEEVQAGRLREDLYYRLMVVPIDLPRLAERDRDVIEIGSAFLTRFASEEGKSLNSFAPDAEAALLSHSWPGNVRELQNVIRQTVVLHDGPEVTSSMLTLIGGAGGAIAPQVTPQPILTDTQNGPQPSAIGSAVAPAAQAATSAQSGTGWLPQSKEDVRPLADMEREIIEAVIAVYDGNIPRAAAALEVSPSTIYRKRQAWEQQDASSDEVLV